MFFRGLLSRFKRPLKGFVFFWDRKQNGNMCRHFKGISKIFNKALKALERLGKGLLKVLMTAIEKPSQPPFLKSLNWPLKDLLNKVLQKSLRKALTKPLNLFEQIV